MALATPENVLLRIMAAPPALEKPDLSLFPLFLLVPHEIYGLYSFRIFVGFSLGRFLSHKQVFCYTDDHIQMAVLSANTAAS